MKKVLSVLLALVLIFALSVSAMALKSSGGTEYHKVVINQTNTGASSEKPKTEIVIKGDTISIVPEKSDKDLTFGGIVVFTDAAAKKAAVVGVDFEVVGVKFNSTGAKAVEGVDYKIDKNTGAIVSLNGELLTVDIKPLSDNLYISENYKDKDGEDVKIEFNVDEDVKSDPTADTYNTFVIIALCLMILGAGFVAVSSKRSFN